VPLGTKAYYGNQCFIKSRLVSKKSKLKLYWSIIIPIITYTCETWVLKEAIGPTKERDGKWRIKTKDELDE
jgi:hypothetical protein